MVKDVMLLVAFWGIVIAPCLLAMKTGIHREDMYGEKEEA